VCVKLPSHPSILTSLRPATSRTFKILPTHEINSRFLVGENRRLNWRLWGTKKEEEDLYVHHPCCVVSNYGGGWGYFKFVNLQDIRAVFRILIALLRFPFDSPSYIDIYIYIYEGTAVAQWLRCCATNRKVAGSIPASVTGYFIYIKSFRSHYDPGIDSASNRNEYQQYFLGVKAAGA